MVEVSSHPHIYRIGRKPRAEEHSSPALRVLGGESLPGGLAQRDRARGRFHHGDYRDTSGKGMGWKQWARGSSRQPLVSREPPALSAPGVLGPAAAPSPVA
jgi:hypothetical protein